MLTTPEVFKNAGVNVEFRLAKLAQNVKDCESYVMKNQQMELLEFILN